MGNLVKKVIASTLCASFLSFQTAFGYQMTGDVLGNNTVTGGTGANGANIVSSSGGFQGFENGGLLGLNKNEATLHFNDNAVINWGQLNVGSYQTLNFANGNHVVLNNVLNGMSTFAGRVTGEQGQIIISNPNGMLMQGGQFETSGSIMFTTKNLTDIKYTDLADQTTLKNKIDMAGYDNDYAVIVFEKGDWRTAGRNTSIEAGDINILAKGIDIKNADLVASKGNVVLQTTDGANFIATGNTQGVKFESGNTIQVATTSIKTPNGGLQLITDKGNVSISSPIKTVNIVDSNVNGNLSVRSNVHLPGSWDELWDLLTGENDLFGDIKVSNSNVSGSTNLTAWGDVIISNSTLGNLFAHSQLKGINVADSTIKGEASFSLPTIKIEGPLSGHTYWEHNDSVICKNTAIGGNILLNVAKDAQFTSPENLHFVNPNVGGVLTADAKNTLSFTKNGSDLNINKAFTDKYKLTAGNELQFKTDKNLIADNTAGTFYSKLTSFFGKNVTLNNIETKGALKAEANDNVIANNIKVATGSIWENILGKQNTVATFKGKDIISQDSSYNGEVVVKANNATFIQNDGKILKIMDSIISNNLIVDSNGEIYIGSWNKSGNYGTPTQIGNADLYTTNKITIWDANISGNTQLTADNSINIYDSNFNTAQMNANSIKSNNSNYAGDISAVANNAEFTSNEKLSFIDTAIEKLFKAHSNKDVEIKDNSKFNNADLKGKNIIATNNANFNGDIKVNAENAQFKTDNKLTFKDSNVSGLFEVENKANLNIIDSIINTAKLTANNIAAKNTNFKNTVTVNATTDASFDTNNDITVTGTVGNNFIANSKGNVSIIDMIANKINATGKNVNLTKTTGDLTIDNNINLTADNEVLVESTNGNLTVDGTTINAKNVTAKAKNNNEVKNVNIAGTLQTSGDRISINDCSSDHLAIINPENNKFSYAEIFGTKANTTEFANGEYLYIDLTNSSLYKNNRNSIIASANNVDKIVIYPTLFGYEVGQETTKNLNNLVQKGVNPVIGTDFSPIAFAANENGRRGGIYKAAGDKIFKDAEEIVHITDRFNIE